MPYYPRKELAMQSRELYQGIREALAENRVYVIEAVNRSPYGLAELVRVALRSADEFPDHAGPHGPGLRDLVMIKVKMRESQVWVEAKPYMRGVPLGRVGWSDDEVVSLARAGSSSQRIMLILVDSLRKGVREFKDADVPNREDVREKINEIVEHLGVELSVFDPPRLVFDSTKSLRQEEE